jgi:hypothetical protein
MISRSFLRSCVLAAALCFLSSPLPASDLAEKFLSPPDSARPWVYWFWNNGNVTKKGITADLEAMQRAGIGGVIIMDVFERFAPPPGTADFMNPEWQELFRFSVEEAHRLGLEINMTNGPGWCGSSGPWITPELSMQKLVATSTTLEGPDNFEAMLEKPKAAEPSKDEFGSKVDLGNYYRDIAVLAYPATPNGVVDPKSVVDLTKNMDATGKLRWKVPAGRWNLARIGHTTTGSSTRPPVKGGNGLEVDKLSASAMEAHFAGMMAKLIKNASPAIRPALSATHIDSWEVGGQNWTPNFREEFQRRRGYDPLVFLPNIVSVAGPVSIGTPEIASRFRWDFAQTVSELLAQNYVGRLADLAHEHGMRLTIEGYHVPIGDEATYTARADEPMSEFWAPGGNENESMARQMSSVAHVMGKKIVGAEAFTSGDQEQWRAHPATVKSLGDYQFSQGINRFVVHRYAHQPYLDRFPGVTMGPWGLHYERTQTWWEMSTGWHLYLSRCQEMLRQGLFVADLLYLRPQSPNQKGLNSNGPAYDANPAFTPIPPVPAGYKYDECSDEALISRASVKDGRIVLPDGMSYRLLVLPATPMTLELIQKIDHLVAEGATVLGPRPMASPTLSGYPDSEKEVIALAEKIWGDCDGKAITEHAYGKGRVLWGQSPEAALIALKTPPDFQSTSRLNWIHRQDGDTEIYFLATEANVPVESRCEFRVKGRLPEKWNPETGEISDLAIYRETETGTEIPLHFEPHGSTFIVFRRSSSPLDPVTSFTRDGQPVINPSWSPKIEILKATYGVPGDADRTRDVRSRLQAMVNAGQTELYVAKFAEGDDPAFGTVKTLDVQFAVDGKSSNSTGVDTDMIRLVDFQPASPRAAEIRRAKDGALTLLAREAGRYEVKTTAGKIYQANIENVPSPVELGGPWDVRFPPKWGAPDHISLNPLASLSGSEEQGVRFFSGTATYTKTFQWTPTSGEKVQPVYTLDLGDVEVMATVTLNGKKFGPFWKAPFQIDISPALKAGSNTLEVKVANLWPNRMIGDAALPVEKRLTWSSFEPFTPESPLPKSGLIGPVSIETKLLAPLKEGAEKDLSTD